MPAVVNVTKDQILAEEEAIKEQVYGHFQRKIEETNSAVSQAKLDLESGKYESQFVSSFASELERQRRKQITVSKEINSLYKKPYFSHIKLSIPADNDTIHCLLTDCPDLDEARTIDYNKYGEMVIVPFRQDAHRKMFGALFSAYQAKNGSPFTVPDQKNPTGEGTVFKPELIRDVTIASRVIKDVRQFFPSILFEEETIDFDDILAQRLDENRESATLRNIIATLQREQYGIIQTPQNESFVVQGCVGSGKSQCLIHRLFFLRSVLAENGWERVLLITPSQLFRNYSDELMRRFRLSSVENTSISELYRELLFRLDDRFKNRQYRYELSEEYLPDEYLRQVYSRGTIEKIRAEIKKAIRKYVDEACEYLNIPMLDEPLSPKAIDSIVEKLDREISAVSLREMERSKDESYLNMRKESEQLEKSIASLKKTQERLLQRSDDLLAKKEQLRKLREDLVQAETELSDWLERIAEQKELLKTDVDAAVLALAGGKIKYSTLGVVNDYLVKAARFFDATVEWGDKFKSDSEHTAFLRSYIEFCQQELSSFSKGKSVVALERSYQKEIDENENRIQEVRATITSSEQRIEDIIHRLQEYTNDENVRNHTKARIEAMEASRFFLSRIESTVFEREIWNALAPLKEQCGIKTVDIENLGNGRRRETRILYKSDLLFYLRIYMFLNKTENLPVYEYICVDEGQDLHAADYETLHELFPTAVFNVFGDVDQALHVDCGISEWQKETGIETVFELNKNYRNTPAVVEFIKDMFGAKMEACGHVRKEQAPTVLTSKGSIQAMITAVPNMAVIVKDHKAFDHLSELMGSGAGQLNYIDTNSSEEKEGTISCFSVFAAKGLEFPEVLVWPEDMTKNQKVVACSRSLNHLYYCNL